MISTSNIKQQQLVKGYFVTGTGEERMLIMGSCRVAPYVNYFSKWNEENGDRFTIYSIDPFNWCWDINDNRTNYLSVLAALEWSDDLLHMIKSVDIFIHEHYQNAGMFNVNKDIFKNIYNFGMKPKIDLSLPNFNDCFILASDIVKFDSAIRKMAVQDYNVIGKLSNETLAEIGKVREGNLDKFYSICDKTDFPAFSKTFKENYKKERYFWTFNHIAKEFTLRLFNAIACKINMEISKEFFQSISSFDMFANNYTFLSEYDEGYSWNEDIKPLRETL